MNTLEITDEITYKILEEFSELANWEGCETGDLCRYLIELYDGCASYASDEFQAVLKKEMVDLYNFLKLEKMEEDIQAAETIQNMSIEDKRKIILDNMSREDKEILGLC